MLLTCIFHYQKSYRCLKNATNDDDKDGSDDSDAQPASSNTYTVNNVYLGATQKRCSINNVEVVHADDPAFQQFQSRFERALKEILSRLDSPVQVKTAQGLSIKAEDFVSCSLLLVADHLLKMKQRIRYRSIIS
jgi:hypothetical protein